MSKKVKTFSKIGRYLLEILIIIIGITISFALNDWDEKRSEDKSYRKYLETLKEDIKLDSTQMAEDIVSYKHISNFTEVILRYDDKFRKDSLLTFALAVDGISNNYIEFLPNNNTFQVLSSTGDFRVFRNKNLVKEIIQLYQYDYAFIGMVAKESLTDRKDRVEPYLLEHIYLEDKETFPDIKTDIPRLIGDPLFRNICYSYKNSCWSAINSYRRAIKRLNKVDQMIEEELKSGF